MKKYVSFLLIPLAVVSFVIPNNAQAQVQGVACPVGFTCVVSNPQIVTCPMGYTCSLAPACPVGYKCTSVTAQLFGCPDGYICSVTDTAISPSGSCFTFTTNLNIGDTGANVVALQIWLISNGYSIPDISSGQTDKGYFGATTAAAVKRYQAAVGLPSTGFVGPLTRANLNSKCNGTFPTPVPPTVTQQVITSAPFITSIGQLYVPFATAYRDVDTASSISVTLGPIFNFSVGDKNSEFTVNSVKVSLGTDKQMITSKFKLFTTDSTGKILKVSPINSNTVVQMPDGTYSITVPVGISMDKNSTHNFAIAVEKANVGIFAKNTSVLRDSIRVTDTSGIVHTGPTQTIFPLKESSAYSRNCGLTVNSPVSGSQVDFPLTIQGIIDNTRAQDNGCSWGMSEGVGGTAQLYYLSNSNEWKAVGPSAQIAVGSWTSAKTDFKVYLNSNNDYSVIPSGRALKIVLSDNNASGNSQYRDTFDVLVYSKTTPTIETKDIKSSTFNGTLSAVLFSTEEDYAGAWDNFGPGAGYGNSNKSDWGWQVSLKVDDANKVIKSMTIVSDIGGEGWSTSRDATDLGKSLYPLVVMGSHGSNQINKEYKDSLDMTQSTGYPFTYYLYGQRESNQSVPGGKLIVRFTDGSQAVMKITNPSISNQPYITNVSGKSAGNFEIDAGGSVGITGTNLMGVYKSGATVYVGGMLGNVTQIDNNLIYFTAPSSLTPGLTYDVYIVNDKGTSNTAKVKVLSIVTQSSITTSVTDPTRINAIVQLYSTLLGRFPDQQGINYWATSGLTVDQIRSGIMKTQEYLNMNKGIVTTSVSPNISIRTPNGNTYQAGSAIQVSWYANYVSPSITIRIFNSQTGKQYYSGTVGDRAFGTNTTILPKEASNIPVSQYFMNICDMTTPTSGKSICANANFNIVSAPSPSPSPSPTPTPNSNNSSSPTPTPTPASNQTRVSSITQLYVTLLNRQPDAQGLNYFAGSSMTIDQIKSILMGSQEYKNLQMKVQQPSPSPSSTSSPNPTPSSSPSAMNVEGNSLTASIMNAITDFFNKL